jgi:aminoglycoside phosphotransferase (APT) family kinase protein
MSVANTLDPEHAARVLQQWYENGATDGTRVRVIDVEIPKSTGMSNETVLFTLLRDGSGTPRREHLAARVPPAGPGLFPDYDLAREHRVMRALSERSALPVPLIRGFEPDPEPLGRPFLIMDRIDGRAATDDPPHTLEGWIVESSAEDRAVLHDNVLTRLAELHQLDVREIGLHDLARLDTGETPAARQLAYVERYASFASPVGKEDPTLAAALDWLRQHCPLEDQPEVLCWGDARLANALIADDLSVAAMLDWEEADIAPPGVDVGYWLYSMRYYSEGLGLPLLPGFPSADDTVARYEELTGHPLEHRLFYEVLATTRSCCIVVRLMNLMAASGMLPPDADLIGNNPSTQLLARTLGLPAPGGRPRDWAGLR